MNQLTIIGNLTRDPELRTTPNGINVCTFTVAVNRKIRRDNEPEADYFEVTAWRERGENCAKYLSKGRKVCVVGAVSVSTYTANDGTTRAKMKVTADEIEFLSPKDGAKEETKVDQGSGYEDVSGSIDEELPF